MTGSVTLPWEDMVGIGGWGLYLFGSILLLGAIARVGYLAFCFWLSRVQLYIAARQRSGRVLSGSPWETVVGISMVFVLAILVWIFIRICVIQVVQAVRFDDRDVVLVYRFPWLNRRIAYHSITKIMLADDRPTLTLPGSHPRGGFPVKVVIVTLGGTYEVKDGPSRWRGKAEAIYNEINRHIADFDDSTITDR